MTPRPFLIGGKPGLRRRLYRLPRVGVATPVFAGPQVGSGTLWDCAAHMPQAPHFTGLRTALNRTVPWHPACLTPIWHVYPKGAR